MKTGHSREGKRRKNGKRLRSQDYPAISLISEAEAEAKCPSLLFLKIAFKQKLPESSVVDHAYT